jgi:membrane-associated PAP2 superfamily phosphatase
VAEAPVAWFQSPLFLPVYLPFLLLALLTVLFRLSEADLSICRLSYDRGGHHWLGADSAVLKFIYAIGPIPALTLGIGGLAAGMSSLFWRPLRSYREAGFFFAAMLALGPGLIVNGVFKPYWNRPRPVQTLAFGGSQPFVPIWESGPCPHSKSFPSGHASMGFYLFAPAFLLYRKRRAWALAFVALGLAGGLVIGAARVLQGAHYPSDVLWSAGMVYLSGLALYGGIQLVKSAANRMDAFASPKPELVVVMLPLSRREPGEISKSAPARRAA